MVTGVQHIGHQCAENIGTLEGSTHIRTRLTAHTFHHTDAAEAVIDCALQCHDDIDTVIDRIQKISDQFDRKLQFRVDKDINRVIIKVLDAATDKVIREIPSEVSQKLRQEFKGQSGILYNEII